MALLCEINETVLARSLRFETDSGACLALDVAGRRVLRLTAATGVDGVADLLAAVALQDNHLDAVVRAVHTLTATAQELRVATAALDRLVEGVSIGLPVARLADALSIDLNAVEPVPTPGLPTPGLATDFIQSMIGHLGETLVAWLIHGGEADGRRGGAEDMFSPLEAFLEDEREPLLRQLDQLTLSPSDPVCTVLGSHHVAGHSILCLRSEGALLVGVLAGDGASAALMAWNAARG